MAVLEKEIRLLVIEDNPGDYFLIQEYLLDQVDEPHLRHVTTLSETEEVLQEETFDAILLDLTLPDARGESLVERVGELSDDTPVIVLTGYENEEFGLKTLSMGIADYLLKDELDPFLLYKSISYSIERSRINRSLRQSEQQYRDLFDLSPQPMWVFDHETLEFLDVNRAAVDHYGYSREEFLSMTIKEIRPEEEVSRLLVSVERFQESGPLSYAGIYRHAKKDGTIIKVEVRSSFIQYNGRDAKIVLANDVTEKIKAERDLMHSEQRFRSLVQEGSDLIAILDEEANYKYVAPSSISTLGISPEELIGTNALEYIHEDDKERIKNVIKNLDEQDRVEIDPFRFKNAEGNWRWIETIVTNMLDNPAVDGIVANSRDVTERIERQRELNESIKRYESVSKATSDTIWDLNLKEDTIRYNENIYSMFGYSRHEVKEAGQWWRKKIHPEDRQGILDQIESVLKSNQDRFQMEYRFQCADETYKDIYDRAFIVNDDTGTPIRIIGAMQDVTEQKEERRWLKLFESAITTTNESVAIIEAEPTDLSGRKILYVNEAFSKMTGYTKEEVTGETLQVLNGPKTSQKKRNQLRQSLEKWEPCEAEFINYTKDGEEFWINVSYAPVKNEDGSFSHWVCVGRDVTNRRQREYDLKESLEEKKVLLMEIHHRVKNNLAIVSGLMQLQAFSEENKDVQQKLMESVSRIQTMGSIHELLYKSESFSKLSLDKNIKQLVSTIINTVKTAIEVDVTYNLDPIILNINQAIPCSLVVNEVITNALQHAFENRECGKLWVSVTEEDGQIYLKIKDDGWGLPDDFEPTSVEKSLGLKLIDTLAKQLHGEYAYNSEETGTIFTLNFQKAEVKGIGNVNL